MAATFPTSPTNGQTTTVNNILYVYSSSTQSWARVLGTAPAAGSNTQIQFNDGNTLGGSAAFTFDKTSNAIVASGNITASYFLGNGSQLTGIAGGGGGNSISSGTSNIAIAAVNGNATVSIGGVSNVVVVSTGVLSVNGLVTTPKTIASNVIIPPNTNSQMLSPVTINSGVVITLPDSSTLYITP